MGITPQSQAYLFTFALILNILGMVLTELWVPMVVGSIVMAALSAESWIRVQHIIPMKKELYQLKKQMEQLQK
jgi:hypothetical protein